jgi:exonuclease III
MKVITWNLGFWQHRLNHEKAWVYLRDQIRPDLALLQEVGPVESRENEHIAFKKIHQNWGTLLYALKMPLEELAIADKFSGRVSAALIEISPQRKAVIASIHAPIIDGRVFPYLDEIFDEIEKTVNGRAFIVGGDLNTARLAEKVWPGHGHGSFFRRLAESVFFDCHQKFHESEEQTFFRAGSKYPFQDDHLFVSHDLADCVKSCYVLDNEVVRSFSDHIPVVAEIGI